MNETEDVSTPRHSGVGRSTSWNRPGAEPDSGADGFTEGDGGGGEAAAAVTATLGLSGGRPGRRFSGFADCACCSVC